MSSPAGPSLGARTDSSSERGITGGPACAGESGVIGAGAGITIDRSLGGARPGASAIGGPLFGLKAASSGLSELRALSKSSFTIPS